MIDGVPGRFWHTDDGLHIDTRGLNPPDPMIAILWHLEQPGQRGPVTVLLDRNPVHLFPELAERGWRWEETAYQRGEVTLILRMAT